MFNTASMQELISPYRTQLVLVRNGIEANVECYTTVRDLMDANPKESIKRFIAHDYLMNMGGSVFIYTLPDATAATLLAAMEDTYSEHAKCLIFVHESIAADIARNAESIVAKYRRAFIQIYTGPSA